ncbi:MAG: tyrosine-type recombinase/integrase [Deltaproteobacteria bacterium]|nr:tyrosine-type recombinase/integrase [Deltaproteobacteria bacterium]
MKRKNCSAHTVKNYMNALKKFILWLDVPVEDATNKTVQAYIDYLRDKRLAPKSINTYLDSVRGFYDYLHYEEEVPIKNPVRKGYAQRLSRPLPKYLRDEEVAILLNAMETRRDQAMFRLLLRTGLRVGELANLSLRAFDVRRRRILVENGKGAKDRIVYISDDALRALGKYLKVRPCSRAKRLFLVERGVYRGKPMSVRGIQKRIEYYAKKTGVKVSCHYLRHTMATQMLNADSDLVTIQDLLGHARIKTTERYCKVSNLKVQRDYFKTMERVMLRLSS